MDDILNKIESKYGTIGAVFFLATCAIGLVIAVFLWLFAALTFWWPLSIPFVAAAWLAYSSHK